MKFKDYYDLQNSYEKGKLAKRLKTSKEYLSQLANQHRYAGGKILRNIEWATEGQVKPTDMPNPAAEFKNQLVDETS